MTLVGSGTRGSSRPWLKWTVTALLIGIVVGPLLARLFIGEVARYRGQEMHPALDDGDWILIDHQNEPERGDIVLVDGDPRPIVRRVVSVTGQATPSPPSPNGTPSPTAQAVFVPEGKIFLRCERSKLCVGSQGIGLVDSSRVRGIITGRWSPPLGQ